ncbi:hypothetical protein PS2_007021 [Malus domestica]
MEVYHLDDNNTCTALHLPPSLTPALPGPHRLQATRTTAAAVRLLPQRAAPSSSVSCVLGLQLRCSVLPCKFLNPSSKFMQKNFGGTQHHD